MPSLNLSGPESCHVRVIGTGIMMSSLNLNGPESCHVRVNGCRITMSSLNWSGCLCTHASCLMFQMPNQYNCGPVKSNAGWHIPYDDGTCGPQSTSQPVLCLRYKGQRASLRHVKKRNASD